MLSSYFVQTSVAGLARDILLDAKWAAATEGWGVGSLAEAVRSG